MKGLGPQDLLLFQSLCRRNMYRHLNSPFAVHVFYCLLQASVPVSMQLEIAPQHHMFMIGQHPRGANIKQIMQRTGANICFPDASTVTPQRKGTVYITGGIESVYLARLQLIVSIYPSTCTWQDWFKILHLLYFKSKLTWKY